METGHVVREQASDDSIGNSEPAVITGAVVGIIGGIGAALVMNGKATTDDIRVLQDQAGIIIPAIFLVWGVGQGIITRFRVWSPRSAARAAVASAERGVPTLPA